MSAMTRDVRTADPLLYPQSSHHINTPKQLPYMNKADKVTRTQPCQTRLITRRPLPVTALLLLPFLAGCGGEGPGETEPPNDPGQATLTGEGTTDASPGPIQISTPDAPEAIGPYSQAILVGSTLYLAGQIALDPTTGEMVEGGIETETHQVLRNLGAVLEAAGFGFGDVVQSQVFLADLDDFQTMNAIYGEYVGDPPPARATMEVARLPRDARVEIQFVAVRRP
jgi:2-iminobutanoate/2-iminopropanoate deaminase